MNSCGNDFEGGNFHFQDGEPKTIIPMAGDVLMYTADSRSVHSVDEVTGGERLTLTLWFSRDSTHDEDTKLIANLSQSLLKGSDKMPCSSYLPSPASSSMYWFTQDQTSHEKEGFDIRWGRLHALGFSVYSQAMDNLSDLPELLDEALQLTRGNQLFHLKFVNIMHALQVVQFHHWRASQPLTIEDEEQAGKVTQLSPSQLENIRSLESVFQNTQLSETVFSNITSNEKALHHFDWNSFSAAISEWEGYSGKLHKELINSFTQWITQQSICSFDI